MRRLVVMAGVLGLIASSCVQRPGSFGAGPSGRTSTPPTATSSAPSSPPASRPSPRSPASSPSGSGTDLPASLIGKQWYRLPTARRVVALTFDAGGNDAGVDRILATLSAQHVPATFFVTGRWVEVFPAQARRIAAAFPIGNHTYAHLDLTKLSTSAARAQIVRGRASLLRVTGHDPRPLFRFPYGAADRRVISIANAAGFGGIAWTVDTRGWMGTSGGITVREIVRSVIGSLRPGEIVLMHVGANPQDHSTLDADALLRVIEALRARGYSFVTVRSFL